MKLKKHNLPKIAIVGRPNVGKSTLFNRIIKRRRAIVEKLGPITRDRIGEIVSYDDISFELIDTGGMDFDRRLSLSRLVEKQALIAVGEADKILFVCDVKTGISPLDHDICELLRKSGKKTLLVINKVDNQDLLSGLAEFYSLGMGEPIPVSSLHDRGITELLDTITKDISGEKADLSWHESALKISVVGKPNAGKSSFINALSGEERIIVSDEPGTTRDSVDTHFEEEKRSFIITDTAGMRSRGKIKDPIVFFSVARTKEAIEKSDVCIILLDGMVGVGKEDFKIIGIADESYKPFVIAVNKWDLCIKAGVDVKDYEKNIRTALKFVHGAPILFISALTGKNIIKTVDKAVELSDRAKTLFSTSRLNEILKAMTVKPTKVYSVQQLRYSVPKFEVIVKKPALIDKVTRSYIENRFREGLDLEGVPIHLIFRKKKFKSK